MNLRSSKPVDLVSIDFPLSQKRIKEELIGLLFCLSIFLSGCAKEVKERTTYTVQGVSNPEISLNGDWDFTMNPPKTYTFDQLTQSDWRTAQVPGGLMMQGFAIKHDSAYLYRRAFEVPYDFTGNTILLRFDGVYSQARAWINGQEAGIHLGGFTRWELEVTDLVHEGNNELWVEVKDRWDDISWASGYAKHQIGGILRDVTLRAIPKNHLAHLYIETDFDEDYQHAGLLFDLRTVGSENMLIEFQLIDPSGTPVPLVTNRIEISSSSHIRLENLIASPVKWDAEHPNLYHLAVTVSSESGSYSFVEQVGFRELEVVDDQLLVNGVPIKLRGANRHDIHPTLGRMTSKNLDSLDVVLAKQANINWIRTSHYPPSDYFLQLCDREGIYVEDETAVCFVQTYRDDHYKPDAFNNDPNYADWFIDQMEEMVHWHRNHPSVVIWSIGNENAYGTNFQKSYDRIKELDPTRPVIFSFPGTVPDTVNVFDILSIHYVNYDGTRSEWTKSITNFSEPGIPTVHDEYAHVACYNLETIREDANVRVFWAESIDRMWSDIFNTRGALGAAIWCFVDETFMIPEGTDGYKKWWARHHYDFPYYTVGYGEWGIIDTWRRRKPEFWGTKKAYSPTKLFVDSVKVAEDQISIPAQNRFDHTNFSELTITYATNQTNGELTQISIEPHEYGIISVPINSTDDYVELDLYHKDLLIDTYFIDLREDHDVENSPNSDIAVEIDMKGQVFTDVLNNGDPIIQSAKPLIRTLGSEKSGGGVPLFFDWMDQATVESFRPGEKKSVTTFVLGAARLRLSTSISDNEISFDLEIEGHITDKPVREVGVELSLADIFDSLSWKRNGFWTKYQKNDLGALQGSISLEQTNSQVYREHPGQDWAYDTKSFYYHGYVNPRLSFLASAYKEDIRTFSLSRSDFRLEVVGTDSQKTSARLFYDESEGLKLRLVSMLDYPNLAWGNYMRNLDIPTEYSGRFRLYVEKKEGCNNFRPA